MSLRIDILTLFPEMFSAILGTSIPKRAAEKGLVEYHLTNFRSFATDRHLSVDDKPFGGGPGMVMMAPIVFDTVAHVEQLDTRPATRILLTPQGRVLDQPLVETLAKKPRLVLITGHYEGFDERIIDGLAPLEVSIGDYVLSGGELAAMVLIDAVVRVLPGVLGAEEGASDESFTGGLLEYPQYTVHGSIRRWTCPIFCSAAIMQPSPNGAWNNAVNEQKNGGLIYGSRMKVEKTRPGAMMPLADKCRVNFWIRTTKDC